MSFPEQIAVPDHQSYYRDAESWAEEGATARFASARRAWIAAGAAGAVALLEAVALAMLVPLKTSVPYVITVDRQTGYAEIAQRLKPGGTLTDRDAVVQSALVQYVLARETFDGADLAEQYRRVQLWSDAGVRRRYIASMARSDPNSPLNLYPGSTQVKVTVKGVTLINPRTAFVRFETHREDPASTSSQMQSYSATIGFRFSGEPMRMLDRFDNPLGFQVTSYRRDAETPAPVMTLADPAAGGLPVTQ